MDGRIALAAITCCPILALYCVPEHVVIRSTLDYNIIRVPRFHVHSGGGGGSVVPSEKNKL